MSPPQENLGIEYLSAALKRAGFETGLVVDPLLFDEPGFIRSRLLSRLFDSRAEVLANILAQRPGMLCLSVTTDYYAWAKAWAAEIKRHLDITVVFGGIHPSSVPERVALEGCVDYVCVGEGERALVGLASALRCGSDASRIPNLWCKHGGRAIANAVEPPTPDLDLLAFADKDLYRSAYPIFDDGYLIATGRGCPLSCSYCCNDIFGSVYNGQRFLRRRSVANVLAELRSAAQRYRPAFIHFVDDVFNYDRRWLDAFLPRYQKEIGLPFSCYAYPDMASDEQALRMRAAGCFKVQIGVQVGDDATRLKVFHRPSKNKNIASAIRAFKSAGIYVVTDNILGLPSEDKQRLAALLDFYDRNPPDSNEVFFLRCYPRSGLTAWAVANGYLDEQAVQVIEDGGSLGGLFGGPDIPGDGALLRKTAALLSLYPMLPRPLRKAILRHKLFGLLPAVPRIPLMIAARLVNHPRYDFNALRAWRRFAYFARRKCYDTCKIQWAN